MDEFFKPSRSTRFGVGQPDRPAPRTAGSTGGGSVTGSTEDGEDTDDEEDGGGCFTNTLARLRAAGAWLTKLPPVWFVVAVVMFVFRILRRMVGMFTDPWQGGTLHPAEPGLSRGRNRRRQRRALKEDESSPPVDGVMAVTCEELLLRREPLLAGYWAARGRLDGAGVRRVAEVDVALVQVGADFGWICGVGAALAGVSWFALSECAATR
jgi:hypothetical protein